jgi:hypothetical protein
MADLAEKLGIKPGYDICLLDAPTQMQALLSTIASDGVLFYQTLSSAPYDLFLAGSA